MTAETQTQPASSTDRIEKQLVVNASPSRVWRAISSADEFGTWFKMKFDGEFAEGAAIRGKLTHPRHEQVEPIEFWIERIQPEEYFSYRWHPFALDSAVDYSLEPTTLVEFRLQGSPDGGTAVTITESGFDGIPLARRAEAFQMNDGGWNGQMKNLVAYVS